MVDITVSYCYMISLDHSRIGRIERAYTMNITGEIFGIPIFIILLVVFGICLLYIYITLHLDLISDYENADLEKNIQRLEHYTAKEKDIQKAIWFCKKNIDKSSLSGEEKRIHAYYIKGQDSTKNKKELKLQLADTRKEIKALKTAIKRQESYNHRKLQRMLKKKTQ